MEIGQLNVKLGGSSSGLTGALNSAMGQVRAVAQQMRRIGRELSGIGMVASAAIAGILAAARGNKAVATELDNLKLTFAKLAESIATALLPTLRQLGNFIDGLRRVWELLNAHTREAIGHWVLVGVKFLAAGAIIGKLAGLVMGLVDVLGVLVTTIGPALLTTLLPIGVIVGVVALGVGALYNAWTKTETGFKSGAASIWETFKTYWDMIEEHIVGVLNKVLDFFTAAVRKIASVYGSILGALGMHGAESALKHVSEAFTSDAVKKGFVDGAAAVVSASKVMAGDIKDSFGYAIDGLKKLMDRLGVTSLVGKVGGAIGGAMSAGAQATPFHPSQVAAVSQAEDLRPKQFENALQAMWAGLTGIVNDDYQVYRSELGDFFYGLGHGIQVLGRGLADAFTHSGGMLGDLIGSIQNAFKPSAVTGLVDVFGGVATVVLELIEKSKTFKEIMGMVNTEIQHIADFLGAILKPLEPIIGALSDLLNAGLTALTPIFRDVALAIQPLAPIIELLAMAFKVLAPLLQLLGLVLKPVAQFIGWLIGLLFPVLKFVAQGVGAVVLGIANAWNAIIGQVSKLLHVLGLGSANGLLLNTQQMQDNLNQLSHATQASAGAQANTTAAVLRMGDAADAATESLTNVPSGAKVALARYLSIDPNASLGSAGVGPGGPAPSSGAPNVTVNVSLDSKPIAAQVRTILGRDSYRRTGTSVAGVGTPVLRY